ncbi:MAG: FimB/Mfa2 family fimbrial subunit [Bacteroidales bacterium]
MRLNSSPSFSEDIGIVSMYAFYQDSSLITSKDVAVSSDAEGGLELPLDETVTLFAVANAANVSSTADLSDILVKLDDKCTSEVFMSENIRFQSDNTVPALPVELTRQVGSLVFKPIEDEATLHAITDFDAIEVTFLNVSTGYFPGSSRVIQESVTLSTTIAEGFAQYAYSFPTLEGESVTLELAYMKDGKIINRTTKPLELSIIVEPSKQSVVRMPILNEGYLEKPFSSLRLKSLLKAKCVILEEYQL